MGAKVERLVNLTIALLETRAPLSLDELRRRTGYYSDGDAQSTRRMFERDKDDLRRLGVPIEVRPVPFSEDYGYLVPRSAYELPDVELTGEQVAALALAVRLTGGHGTPLALAKLAARAPDPVDLPPPAATRVHVPGDPLDEVADAIASRTPVTFEYRTAAGVAGTRRVDPYGVAQRRAAWYLVGRDHDRDALRAFRFDRMVTPPRSAGDPGGYTVPDDVDVAAAVTGPEAERVEVTVAAAPRSAWMIAQRGGEPTGDTHDGRPVYRLTGVDTVRDRAWLLGMGADVVVLDPPTLRDDVIGALRRCRAAHAEVEG